MKRQVAKEATGDWMLAGNRLHTASTKRALHPDTDSHSSKRGKKDNVQKVNLEAQRNPGKPEVVITVINLTSRTDESDSNEPVSASQLETVLTKSSSSSSEVCSGVSCQANSRASAAKSQAKEHATDKLDANAGILRSSLLALRAELSAARQTAKEQHYEIEDLRSQLHYAGLNINMLTADVLRLKHDAAKR